MLIINLCGKELTFDSTYAFILAVEKNSSAYPMDSFVLLVTLNGSVVYSSMGKKGIDRITLFEVCDWAAALCIGRGAFSSNCKPKYTLNYTIDSSKLTLTYDTFDLAMNSLLSMMKSLHCNELSIYCGDKKIISWNIQNNWDYGRSI